MIKLLFRPSTWLMERLSYSKKIIVIGSIFVIAASFLSANLYHQLNITIVESEQQLIGIEKVAHISELIRYAQQYRGLSAAIKSGSNSFTEIYNNVSIKIEKHLQEIILDIKPEILAESQYAELKELKETWHVLSMNHVINDLEEDFHEHTQHINHLILLLKIIGDHYKLFTDGDLSSYYLIDSSLYVLPNVAEDLAKIRGIVLSILVKQELTKKQTELLIGLESNIERAFNDLKFASERISKYSPQLEPEISNSYAQLLDAKSSALEIIHKDIFSEKFTTSPLKFYHQITAKIDVTYQLINNVFLPSAQRHIKERISKLYSILVLTISLTIFLWLVCIYLLVGLYLSVRRNIKHVNNILNEYSMGNLEPRIEINTFDEMRSISQSINFMAENFNQMINENRDEKDRFKTLFEKSGDGIVLLDDGKFIDCNERAVEILGYDNKSDLMKTPSELSPEYQPDGQLSTYKSEQMNKKCIEDGSNQFEWIHKKKDGSNFWVDVLLTRLNYKEKNIIHVTWRDISKTKSLELLRDKQAKRLNTTIELAMDASIQMNAKSNIIGWNKQAEEIFGWSKQRAIGQKLHKLIIPKKYREAHLVAINMCLITGKSSMNSKVRITALHANGKEFPVELAVSMIKIGDHVEFSAFIRDLTEQKEYERSIINATQEALSANKAKSQFLANMSHELRTPMHGILSFANFGIKKGGSASPDKIKQYFENINTSAKRLLILLNDLLDLSKLEAGKIELDIKENSLREIVDTCYIEQQQRLKDLDIQLEISSCENGCKGEFDKIAIAQIITNLLSNSIKFSPTSSTIYISISERELELCFVIKDSGIGIPESELTNIFDPFKQSSNTKTGAGGTGLGLAICKKLITAHKGKIWAKNNRDTGTSFYFTIPSKQILNEVI